MSFILDVLMLGFCGIVLKYVDCFNFRLFYHFIRAILSNSGRVHIGQRYILINIRVSHFLEGAFLCRSLMIAYLLLLGYFGSFYFLRYLSLRVCLISLIYLCFCYSCWQFIWYVQVWRIKNHSLMGCSFLIFEEKVIVSI